MVWLIALAPAVIVYIIVAASESRTVWFWASLGGLCVAFLGFSSYFFLDVCAVFTASYLAWRTVDFKARKVPDSQGAPANWASPRTSHKKTSGQRPPLYEVKSPVTTEVPYRAPPTRQELAFLRAKIEAEHKANAAQRERDARKAANSKNGERS